MPFLTAQNQELEKSPHSVLFLFSYHPGHEWEDVLYKTLLEGMKENHPGVDLFVQYMDSKRYSLEERADSILTQLRTDIPLDLLLIVAVDDNALHFLTNQGQNLFPGVPIVFCGINDYPQFQDKLKSPHTGVISRVNLQDTLKLAQSLIPGVKKVFVISDATPTGYGNKQMVEDQARNLQGDLTQLDFHYIDQHHFSTDELLSWSGTLKKDSIILLTSWYRDERATFISEKEFVRRLQGATSVPVFNLLHIRQGVLGGKVTSGENQAKIVLEQINSIVKGTNPFSIPIVDTDTSIYVIDHERMNHWGFRVSLLPEDVLLLNKSPVTSYRITIQLLGFSILVLLLIMLTLIRQSILLNKSSAEVERQKHILFTTLNSIGDGVISTDRESTVTFLNEVAQRISGWSLEEALSQPLSQILSLQRDPNGESLIDPVQKILRGSPVHVQEQDTMLLNRHGLNIHILVRFSPIHDPESGTLSGVIIVFRDISDSDKMQQKLHNEQRRLRDAQAMAMVGNWEYDPEFDRYWYSKEVFTLTGIHPNDDEVPESLDLMKIIFSQWKKDEPLTAMFHNEDSLVKSLMTIPSKDGIRILHLMARLARNPESGKIIVTGIIQDFSELTQTRAALKASQEQLRQAARMEAVGKLAGGIAHEFNNLLQIILGYSQLLKDEAAGQQIVEYVEPILKTAASARNLTRQLLLFSRKENLDMEAFSMSRLVYNLIPIFSRLLEENIQLKSDLQGGDDWVLADKHQIEQVLINLCLNARDAMLRGGILTISQSIESTFRSFPGIDGTIPAGDYVHLTVQDNGSGIDESILPEIFDPFFTTKEREKGTGLGLSIVYGIIRQHEGYLNVKTDPEKGSSFHIYLPRIEPTVSTSKKVTFHENHEEPVVDTIVYMAEDDPMVRQLTETMLRNSGYIVKSFMNGKALIETLEKKPKDAEQIDLFLLDVIMPELGGVQAYHKLRSSGYDVPVLFMSGYTEERLKNLPEFHNVGLIRKPFTLKDLTARIQALLA
jgi:PAS domain S-box-containing protein